MSPTSAPMVFRHSISLLLLLLLCSSPSFLAEALKAPAFKAPLLSSVITPSLDKCTKDPEGWVKAPVTSVAQEAAVSKILTAQHNASFLWGTYQPNQYFAVKSRTAPATVASGILWHGPGKRLADARSECKHEDKIKKYGWTQHDGRRYGRQVIEDEVQGVKLVTEYVREEKKEKGEDVLTYWATRIHVTPTTKQGSGKKVQNEEEDENGEDGQQRALQDQHQRGQAVLYLYLAIDCDGAVSEDECLGVAGGEEGLQLLMDRNKDAGAAYIHGKTKDLGAFTLEIGMSGDSNATAASGALFPLSISYWGSSRVMLADLKDKLEDDAERRLLMTRTGGDDLESLVGASRRKAAGASGGSSEILPDAVSDYSNVVVIRIAGAGPFQVDARLRAATPPDEDEEDEDDEPAARSDVAKLKALLDDATNKGMQGFQDRFSQVFQLERHGYLGRKFTPAEVEAAQAAFSNMIGGVGYFHGRTPIKGKEDEEVLASFPSSLFSAVPSRSFFPRGFLWDEGFHHLLLHKWDLGLTYDVLLHWLSHMHAHADCPEVGWIPREIALGEQARRRIPEEFLPQDVTVANPPTFLLTLEKVLGLAAAGDAADEEGKQQQQCTDSGTPLEHRQEFLQAIQDRLEKWLRWLLTSQRGIVTGTFYWRGRGDPTEKLMATTFASGLDDYPRASEPNPLERHVDLLCWVIKGCQILSKLAAASGTAGSEETSKKFAGLEEELVGALEMFHWNETLGGHGGGFFDFGIHSEEGFIGGETFAIRCGNPQKKEAINTRVDKHVLMQWDPENAANLQPPCPPEFPVVVGMLSREPTRTYVRGSDVGAQHVPRVGYVSMFPLLLGLLPADSPRLGPLLKTLRDPEQLWSPYGIRSLSAADPFYQEENAPGDAPYWRGYIWININYLALRALWQLSRVEGPYQAEATKTYGELRENLLSTILGQYEKTGYFWEQYNDVTGEGMRCHPFTGWTALVVNIMAEDY